MPLRPRPWQVALALALLVVLAYLPALQCGFIWDDDDYVTQNPVLRTAGGLWRIWTEPTSIPQYYPLVHTTFWIEYRLWGLAPLGYHLVNVLLHAANAVLLWRLLRRLAVPGALFAAALFALHPVHVESVAWVTERKNVLSLCFYLLAAHAWFRWRDGGGRKPYVLALLAYLAALLCKTVTCSLPAALLLAVWWKGGRVSRREMRSTLPMFAVGALLAWLTVHLEQTHVGAAGQAWDLSAAERILVAGRAAWFYLGKLLLPVGLCFNYPRWSPEATALWQWLYPAAAVVLLATAWALRGRLGRGPLVALLFFGGTLLPALGVFDVFPFRYSFVADHFQYHASIGALVLLGAGGVLLARRYVPPSGGLALAAAVLTLCGALTWHQIRIYRDLETLWTDTLQCNPDSAIAHTNLGKLRLDRGEEDAALVHLERALELDPGSYESHVNLGVLVFGRGDLESAREHFAKALELKPGFAAAHNNLAVTLHAMGHPEQALGHVQRALDGNPDYYDAHVTAVTVLHGLRRWTQALEHAEWVLRRTPDAREVRGRAVDCLLALGHAEQAVGNALLLAKGTPGDGQARDRLVRALEAWIADQTPEAGARKAAEACRALGGAAPDVLRALAAHLSSRGRDEQASAVRKTAGR